MSRANRAGFTTIPNDDSDAPIIDSLLSTRTTSALSARAGNELFELASAAQDQATTLAPKGVTVPNPTAPLKLPLLYVVEPVQMLTIFSVVLGAGPSVTFSVRYGSDISQAGTEVVTGGIVATSTSTGHVTTSFNNPVVQGPALIWVSISAVSGTVSCFHSTVIMKAI